MSKLKLAALLGVIIVIIGLGSQVAFGETQPPGQLIVVITDGQAIASSGDNGDVAESFVGLVSALREGQSFAFISLNKPAEILGPAAAGSPEFKTLQDGLRRKLSVSAYTQDADWTGALAEAYNLLGRNRAAPGSTVYLLAGNSSPSDVTGIADGLLPVATLYRSSGWSIVGLSFPGASSDAKILLDRIATTSGGESFELSIPAGFKRLADKVLREETKGGLADLGGGVLSSREVLTSTLSVAPGTREATLLFFKQGRYGSLRLTNPSGFEASAGDRTASSVFETPNLVIWRLIDPVPGTWRVDVRGIEGTVSAWHYAVNKYIPVFQSYGAIVINEPSTLVAYISDGKEKVVVSGVTLTARTTTPEGTTLLHTLNDRGVAGDAVAGDGYFSATIPPVTTEGEYGVELVLLWPEYGHQVITRSRFAAQSFPAIEVTPAQTEELRAGVRTKVATLLVHVANQPYAISPDELKVSLASGAAQTGKLDVEPQRLLGPGQAWTYDVYFTPEHEGLSTLSIGLSLEYAGRQYVSSPEVIVVSAPAPDLPPAPAPALPQPVAAAPVVEVPPSGINPAVLALAIIAGIAVVAGALYWLSRPRPYGYLYNDRDQLVVEFARIRRRLVTKLLFKNLVRGRELGLPGLEKISFKFSGTKVSLHSRQALPTIRVNNEPVIGTTTIEDKSWIGAQGKLYSFLRSPGKLQAQSGVGDDN